MKDEFVKTLYCETMQKKKFRRITKKIAMTRFYIIMDHTHTYQGKKKTFLLVGRKKNRTKSWPLTRIQVKYTNTNTNMKRDSTCLYWLMPVFFWFSGKIFPFYFSLTTSVPVKIFFDELCCVCLVKLTEKNNMQSFISVF